MIAPDGVTAKGYLDSEAWVKAGTYWSNLYNEWAVSPKSLGYGEAASLFGNGQLAMFAGGTWNLPILAQTGVDFGVAPFPYFEGGKVLTPTGSWYVGVSAASTNQAEAFDFAKFLTTSDEGTRVWFKALNQLPVSKPLLDEISTSADFDAFPNNVFRLGVYDFAQHRQGPPGDGGVRPAAGCVPHGVRRYGEWRGGEGCIGERRAEVRVGCGAGRAVGLLQSRWLWTPTPVPSPQGGGRRPHRHHSFGLPPPCGEGTGVGVGSRRAT